MISYIMSLKISSISTKFHVILIFIIFLSRVSDASNDVNENNPCYNSEGVAINCQPEFVNAAFGKSVQATSTCGSPAHEFCAVGMPANNNFHSNNNNANHNYDVKSNQLLNRRLRQQPHQQSTRYQQQQNGVSSCFVCDTSNPVLSHPPSHLTDPHNSNNLTCWVSDIQPIRKGLKYFDVTSGDKNDNFYQQKQNQQQQKLRYNLQETNLTISLGKKFEVTYVSLQFCHTRPDSLAIYKSSDFGQTWIPFQFFSSQCEHVYGRKPRNQTNKWNKQEAFCSEDFSQTTNFVGTSRVAFNTLEGRSSNNELDANPMLQDWQTATDIRIVFNRLKLPLLPMQQVQHQQANYNTKQAFNSLTRTKSFVGLRSSNSGSANRPARSNHNNNNNNNNYYYNNNNNNNYKQGMRKSTRDISPTAQLNSYSFYSMSDVAIGGRCKCNGHASRCAPVAKSRYSKEVKLVCQCQHNTDGDDCERCKPFYMDRPWSRGGRTNTTECVACNCNNHSNKCHFDPEIFALTNNQTGGVCEDCLHNTVGRNCHQCRNGYYRDLSKPLTHKHACKKCHCHQSGSVESSCHPETGQCPCKPGVTGLTCNRCAPGYQQSESILKPCVLNCDSCLQRTQLKNLQEVCSKDFVLVIHVQSRKVHKKFSKYGVKILKVFKKLPNTLSLLSSSSSSSSVAAVSNGSKQKVQRSNLDGVLWLASPPSCSCKKLKRGMMYLLIGRSSERPNERYEMKRNNRNKPTIILDQESIAVKWSVDVEKKLRKLVTRETGKSGNRC